MEGNPTCWRTGWRERKRLTAGAWRLLEKVIDIVLKGNPHLKPCREDVRYSIIKVGESITLRNYKFWTNLKLIFEADSAIPKTCPP